MATEEFYIRNESETEARGPFNLEQLISLIDSNQITLETLFYDANTEQWAAIGSNEELKHALFPEKKKLKIKAKEQTQTLNTSSDSRPPITVDDMLAAAEGRTDDTGDKRDPAIAQARAAGIGAWCAIAILVTAAVGELLPSIDFLTAFDTARLLEQPLVLLGGLDLVLAMMLGLGVTQLYPLVRFRAALGLGFLGFIFYAQGQSLPFLAVAGGSFGLYLCTISISLMSVLIAAALGLAGMGAVTYSLITG